MKWTERTELLLGNENTERLKKSNILICGLGGVGGSAAEQLVRAGIGNLTIIDADIISESNINRQIIATHNNIGENKTSEFYKRLLAINPELNLSIKETYLDSENLEEILLMNWDFVIDAIDTLSPKFNLLRICHQNKIPLISSMGAGGKTDPSKIKIDDISKTFNCGLSRMLRKRLHKIEIYKDIKVVFSSQLINKEAIIEEESKNKKSNLGTISYMPNIFGCLCAYTAINHICEFD